MCHRQQTNAKQPMPHISKKIFQRETTKRDFATIDWNSIQMLSNSRKRYFLILFGVEFVSALLFVATFTGFSWSNHNWDSHDSCGCEPLESNQTVMQPLNSWSSIFYWFVGIFMLLTPASTVPQFESPHWKKVSVVDQEDEFFISSESSRKRFAFIISFLKCRQLAFVTW